MAENEISFQESKFDDSTDSHKVKITNGGEKTILMTSDDFEPGKNPSLCQQLFSWRALVLILLSFSIVAISLPRSTFNMAFVCSMDRRLEAIRITNWSAESFPVGDRQYLTNGQLLRNSSRRSSIVDAAGNRYHQNVSGPL